MFLLKPNHVINFKNKEWIIDSFTTDRTKVILRDLLNKKIEMVELKDLVNELYNSLNSNNRSKPEAVPFENKKLTEVALKRKEIIDEILKYPNFGRKEVEEVARKHNIHYATIYRWLKRYQQNGIFGLFPEYSKRGPKEKLPKEVKEIIDAEVKSYYLTAQKPNVKSLHERIVTRCKDVGLHPPHYNSILRIVHNLNPYEVTLKRENKLKASTFQPVTGKLEATNPFEIIQIDHTKLDIIVVDEFFRKPVGRPWITLALDVYSRMVYGFYLSLDAPSYFSVAQALFMGIQPKSLYLEKWELADEEWPIFGLPKGIVIHTDNAKEFRSKEMENFLKLFNIHQEFRPKRTPHYGGHIERFFRTLNEELHKLPGTTFSNPKQKGDYNPEKFATMTLTELEKYIATWIVKIYHKKDHSSLGISPLEAFKKVVFGDETRSGTGFPPIPSKEELERIRISLLYTETRTIQRYGIIIDHITYWHEVLIPFIGSNEKFIFKIDPRDISYIYFYHPKTQEYYEIPCKNPVFPPLTRWELREVIKYLKNQRKKEINEYTILEAYQHLERLKQESIEKSKKARRSLTSKRKYQKEITEVIKGEGKNKEPIKTPVNIQEFEVYVYEDES